MATLPGGVLWDPRWQAFDANGEPLSNCKLFSYTTGGSFSTPQSLYTDSALTIAHANPVVADSAGRFAEMFMLAEGYDLRLKDENDVTIWSATDVEDIGQSFLTSLGETFATGSTAVTSGYVMLTTDNYIETAAVATNPFILTLQTAATRTFPVCIKHKGSGTLRITPVGAETIEGIAAYYSVAAAASPNFPTVWLWPLSSGTGYVIGASHGL